MYPYKVFLIGSGYMAKEYAKVLKEINIDFIVSSRNIENLERFSKENENVYYKPYNMLKKSDFTDINFAIIAVSVENLYEVCKEIITLGCKLILLEKPGTLTSYESSELYKYAIKNKCEIRIAYNRRFFQTIKYLKNFLKNDYPISCFFDFTEWKSSIQNSGINERVLARWAIANSSHVFDTVKYLLGNFHQLNVKAFENDMLSWHKTSIFIGDGYLGRVPFSYSTSWISPGRWNIEIMTLLSRYKLSPMEKLQVLKHDTVVWSEIQINNDIDINYKSGLYEMLNYFIDRFVKHNLELDDVLPDLLENYDLLMTIEKIAGYKNE